MLLERPKRDINLNSLKGVENVRHQVEIPQAMNPLPALIEFVVLPIMV